MLTSVTRRGSEDGGVGGGRVVRRGAGGVLRGVVTIGENPESFANCVTSVLFIYFGGWFFEVGGTLAVLASRR